jgi:valyl-tRNA synthetase
VTIWCQVSRLGSELTTEYDREAWTLADSWIWARLQQLVRDVERLFQNFQYGQAGQQIYDFIWSDFADWYVEIAKGQMQNAESRMQTTETLVRVFDAALAASSVHAVRDRIALDPLT